MPRRRPSQPEEGQRRYGSGGGGGGGGGGDVERREEGDGDAVWDRSERERESRSVLRRVRAFSVFRVLVVAEC